MTTYQQYLNYIYKNYTMHFNVYFLSIFMYMYEVTSQSVYIYIYICMYIIDEAERKLNQNFKLEFQFCTTCPKLFILKEFYFLILESNVGPHHKYLSK